METGRSGKNALDLVLAHYLGEARKADPQGYFHIVSKDKDFDALIGHLRVQGALAARHATFGEIPVLMNLAERLKFLANYFKANHNSRPKKQKKLESLIQAMFGKALLPDEIEETIRGLIVEKTIALSEKATSLTRNKVLFIPHCRLHSSAVMKKAVLKSSCRRRGWTYITSNSHGPPNDRLWSWKNFRRRVHFD